MIDLIKTIALVAGLASAAALLCIAINVAVIDYIRKKNIKKLKEKGIVK
jgi:hypothetical protein